MNVNKSREKGAVIILYCSNRNLFTVCHTWMKLAPPPPPAEGTRSNFLQLWRLWNLGRSKSSSLIQSGWQCDEDKCRKLISPGVDEWLINAPLVCQIQRLLCCEWWRPSLMSFPRILAFTHLRCLNIGGFNFFSFSWILKLNNFTNCKRSAHSFSTSSPVEWILWIAAVAFEHCLCCSRPTDTQQHKGCVPCARLKIETSAGRSRESL